MKHRAWHLMGSTALATGVVWIRGGHEVLYKRGELFDTWLRRYKNINPWWKML